MARAASTTKSNPLAQRHTSVVCPFPPRDPRPILPPIPQWKKVHDTPEAQKSLKRPRESIELVNQSGQKEIVRQSRIIPPSPRYSNPKRQTRSLDPPPRVQQVKIVPPPLTHKSQPDESRGEEVYEKWSPKRLRSREPRKTRLRQYVDSDDSMDDLDESSEDEGSVEAEPAEGKEYDVEGIDGERIAPGTHEYWIRWVGYVERTWTASIDCFCPDLTAEMRAVQGADLDAARSAGRKEEVAMLEQLRDAARTEAQSFDGDSTCRAPKSRKTRNKRNGRFQSTRSQSVADSIASSDSLDEDEVKNEPDMPRDARANTAWRRLGSAEREQANDTRYIAWFRSKPIDVDALMENDKQAGPTTAVEVVEAWRAATSSDGSESVGEGWPGEKDAQEEGGFDPENSVNMHQADIQQLGSPNPLLELGSDPHGNSHRQHNYVATSDVKVLNCTAIHMPKKFSKDAEVIDANKEAEEIASSIARKNAQRQAVEKEVHIMRQKWKQEDMADEDNDAGEPSRATGVTYIKDEQDEANKLRERILRRRTLQVLDNAFAATAPNISSLRSLQSATQLNSDTSFSAASGPVDNAKKLKAAREKELVEAVRRQNTNMPRLQLDSQSARYVQEVVRQTRAVPARVARQVQGQILSGMQTRSGIIQRLVPTIET
ncbi:hypothetical protein BKA61DRAFT_739478 [Leptodontidium sp. MPI-SDFR-AT-0119]|nr:hypothetical protein BKA61DRAFT_739478 [Leptodontidium sp. MPI-SDFR-AT-0119]